MPAAPAASPACPASRRATSPKPAARPAAPWSSPARARWRAWMCAAQPPAHARRTCSPPPTWWTRCTPSCWPAAAPGGWMPPPAALTGWEGRGGGGGGRSAATGGRTWLEGRGRGRVVGVGRLPLVPAAVLFDLQVGDMRIRPGAAAGHAACADASSEDLPQGNVGAGTGATIGKVFGMQYAMKGGIGSASITIDGVTVGALIACNALGDVIDPDTARVIAGARSADGLRLRETRRALLHGDPPQPLLAGSNTTIGVVATDAILTKAQAHRLAVAAHDGLARRINPGPTMSDGDTLFALGTGRRDRRPGMLLLATLAAEVTAIATARAARAAHSITTAQGLYLPGAADWG